MAANYINTDKGWLSDRVIVRIAEMKPGGWKITFTEDGSASEAVASEEAMQSYWDEIHGRS